MSPHLRITVLVDDRAPAGLLAEHGFSLWIETGERRILFDTGQGDALRKNAKKLGINLRMTEMLILSHGHYDHTGGISHVLSLAPNLKLYCHPGIANLRYGTSKGLPKPIGIQRRSLRKIQGIPKGNVHWITDDLPLGDGAGITGPIPRETNYENTGGRFYSDLKCRCADLIEDDIALWLQTDRGLVVCVGCCHAGIANTLNHIRKLNNGSGIAAVIGGLHLLNSDAERLESTTTMLKSINANRIVPCHCTGEAAVKELRDVLGSDVVTTGYAGFFCEF